MKQQSLNKDTEVMAILARAASRKDVIITKVPVCMGYVGEKLIAVPIIAETLDYSEDKKVSGYIDFPEDAERIPAGSSDRRSGACGNRLMKYLCNGTYRSAWNSRCCQCSQLRRRRRYPESSWGRSDRRPQTATSPIWFYLISVLP